MDDNFIAKLGKKNSENIKRFEENLNKLERKITTPIGKKIELLNQVPPRKSRYDDKTNKIIFYGDPIDNTNTSSNSNLSNYILETDELGKRLVSDREKATKEALNMNKKRAAANISSQTLSVEAKSRSSELPQTEEKSEPSLEPRQNQLELNPVNQKTIQPSPLEVVKNNNAKDNPNTDNEYILQENPVDGEKYFYKDRNGNYIEGSLTVVENQQTKINEWNDLYRIKDNDNKIVNIGYKGEENAKLYLKKSENESRMKKKNEEDNLKKEKLMNELISEVKNIISNDYNSLVNETYRSEPNSNEKEKTIEDYEKLIDYSENEENIKFLLSKKQKYVDEIYSRFYNQNKSLRDELKKINEEKNEEMRKLKARFAKFKQARETWENNIEKFKLRLNDFLNKYNLNPDEESIFFHGKYLKHLLRIKYCKRLLTNGEKKDQEDIEFLFKMIMYDTDEYRNYLKKIINHENDSKKKSKYENTLTEILNDFIELKKNYNTLLNENGNERNEIEKGVIEQEEEEEEGDTDYKPLRITNINSSSSKEERTGNGSNQCWLNSVLYLFFSLKQVTDKCDPLHDYQSEIGENVDDNIVFRKKMYEYLKKIQTDNYLWNKKNYDGLTKKFIEEIRVQRICNQTEYGEGDIETLQKTLDTPYEYGDHQIALKYIFSLIIACNFNKLDLILLNSVAMPKNLRELFENNEMQFISNDDKMVLNNFNEKQKAAVSFAQYDQIYYNDTNRELLSNILTKQFELMYENKNFGTYECVAFIISTNYITLREKEHMDGEHYVTYVRKGKSSGKKWVRWDAYKINDKDEEVVELNTSKDLFEIENSKKENEKMEIKYTENSYRYFTPLFLRITGTGDLDINKSGQLIKKFSEANAKANKSSSVAAPTTTTPPPSTKANSDNSGKFWGLLKRSISRFSGLSSKNEETEPLLTKKGGKRKTKKNRKRKTNKKLNKLSNNSSNKKRIKKKKKSLKH